MKKMVLGVMIGIAIACLSFAFGNNYGYARKSDEIENARKHQVRSSYMYLSGDDLPWKVNSLPFKDEYENMDDVIMNLCTSPTIDIDYNKKDGKYIWWTKDEHGYRDDIILCSTCTPKEWNL